MEVYPLTLNEKLQIKTICQDMPNILNDWGEVGKSIPLEEARLKTAKAFVRAQKAGKTLDEFYTENTEYVRELAAYTTNPGRIQSIIKRVQVLRALGARHIVDFGSGIGVDGICYAMMGIKVINVEFLNASSQFNEYLFDTFKSIFPREDMMMWIPPDKFWEVDKQWHAVQAIEVVAHLEDPYTAFANIMQCTDAFLWTNDIGTDHNESHDPQHLPHNLNKVIKSIETAGGVKTKIEGMAIPPRLYLSWEKYKEKVMIDD